jgi:hypothetical protein
MSFNIINNDWRNYRNFMSELTLRSHGSEVGQQFTWECTCERIWEHLIERE